MKLVRFGEVGEERPGVLLDDGRILDVRGSAFHIADFDEHFFSHAGLEQLASLLSDPSSTYVSSAGVRLGVPVARPSKIICVGANYADHAAEFGHDIPQEPILFSKATTALVGANDSIQLPAEAEVVDGEAELAVVIGRRAFNVPEADALDYVAGYTVVNDVTERVVQKGNGQWFRGKGFDTFCPMGPCLVTPDEVDDLGELRVWQRLNGEVLQEDSTRSMLFSIPRLLATISSGMTLLPGDVIATGTPAGIGSARNPQILLQAGDVVEVGVDGIGQLKNAVVGVA